MAIKKLDTKTVARLRSSLFTNSISQIVSELLQNALDANPTQVEVAVNFAEGFVEVRDDGDGIEPEDFRMLGLRFVHATTHHLAKDMRLLMTAMVN
ncbi:histidine kinase-like ATPase [Chytridium lagenaria]|nr:histidine kinase-like ATPase [Chytridium lagenaria]